MEPADHADPAEDLRTLRVSFGEGGVATVTMDRPDDLAVRLAGRPQEDGQAVAVVQRTVEISERS